VLIAALERLPASIRLLIVGGDEEGSRLNAVQEMAARSMAANQVHFTGPVSAIEARALVAGAQVAVACFADSTNMRHFACPLKLLEYHAAGVPLVSTDHPTVQELVTPGIDGLLVPADDPRALADALHRLLQDPDLAARLAKAGLEQARTRTWLERGVKLRRFLDLLDPNLQHLP